MDPLSALSLAGTVVQFEDFGSRLFSDAKKLYESSTAALTVNVQLEHYASDLRALLAKLRESNDLSRPQQSPTPQETSQKMSFEKICDGVEKVATHLVDRLDNLKSPDGKHKAWESLQAAVKAA